MVKLVGGSYHGYNHEVDLNRLWIQLLRIKPASEPDDDLLEYQTYVRRVYKLPGNLFSSHYYAEESLSEEQSFEMLKEILNDNREG